jgi:hypothetical protein
VGTKKAHDARSPEEAEMKDMNRMVMAATAMVLIGQNAHAESCSDILSRGVFEVTQIDEDASLKESFRKFQCTTEISTAQDARGLGIGIGVPIYGVPVKLDTTYSKQHIDAWKKDHCSSDERWVDSQSAKHALYSRVSPEIVGAWKACMIPRHGARCDLQGDGSKAILRYSYQPHNTDDARSIPKVKSVSISGMTCKSAPSAGDFVGLEDTAQICTRDQSKSGALPAVFVLNLDKGSCVATLEGTTPPPVPCKEFKGETVFTSDTTINEPRVCLKEGAVLRVKNGATLTITADELVVQGKRALIDATGEAGSKGSRGAVGNGGGIWPAHTDRDYHNANGDCSKPGHPDRGGRGGQGGTGGRGGSIIIRAVIKGTLEHDVKGGPGGPGGDPGQSLTHVRPGGRDPWTCPNDGHGPTGAQGSSGTYSYEPHNAGYRG